MLKDSKGALEDFRAAIKLSPHSAHMYLNRGNLYASTQQYELAEKDYTKGKTDFKVSNFLFNNDTIVHLEYRGM